MPSSRSSSDGIASGADGGSTTGAAPTSSSAFVYVIPSAISARNGSLTGAAFAYSSGRTSDVVIPIRGLIST